MSYSQQLHLLANVFAFTFVYSLVHTSIASPAGFAWIASVVLLGWVPVFLRGVSPSEGYLPKHFTLEFKKYSFLAIGSTHRLCMATAAVRHLLVEASSSAAVGDANGWFLNDTDTDDDDYSTGKLLIK